jgi:hypothetical protein
MHEELKAFIRECIFEAVAELMQPQVNPAERPSESRDPRERQLDRLEDVTNRLSNLSLQLAASWKSKGCLYKQSDIDDILNRVKIIESKI